VTAGFPADRLDTILKEIRPQWMAWLRRRRPGLQSWHEDVVQDAATDLVQHVSAPERRDLSDEDVRRIGFTILRRRAADSFRDKVLSWDSSALDQIADAARGANPEQVQEFTKVLRVVLELLAPLDRKTRNLIAHSQTSSLDDAPLSDAERQRLARLRADLRRQLAERFNIDVKALLKD
jgi:hypothetical protein